MLHGQFFAPENPNVMNAADGFKAFLQTVAAQAGVDYVPGATAADSLDLFLQAVAAREQTATPPTQPASAPQSAAPQNTPFYNAQQPVYTTPQMAAPATAAPAKNPLAFWATVATVLLTLGGKG